MQHGACSFASGRKGPGSPTEYWARCDRILRILRYPRYIYTAKTLYGDTGELLIEELLQTGHMTMSSLVRTVADRLTQNMEGQCPDQHHFKKNMPQMIETCFNGGLDLAPYFRRGFSGVCFLLTDGCSVDYSEVSSIFSKLVETHFLQRCPPPVAPAAATVDSGARAAAPAVPSGFATLSAESFADCYRVPHVTLVGRGKRQHTAEDGEEQRSAKRARMDSKVSK